MLALLRYATRGFIPLLLPAQESASGPLATSWATRIDPQGVHAEYPRPMMRREEWLSLNGFWDYAIASRESGRPEAWQGRILVPFAVESALGGVSGKVGAENRIWYRRTFPRSSVGRVGKRLLLHFGAVDWEVRVWVNAREVGSHSGGYDAFSFDITDTLIESPEQEIVVAVWDPTDQETQPRGKQVSRPEGIWYTSVTGIWQSVWLEPVSPRSIRSLLLTPQRDAGRLKVEVRGENLAGLRLLASAQLDDGVVAHAEGLADGPLLLDVPTARPWSPAAPHLHQLEVRVADSSHVHDHVSSYFGMREVEMRKDSAGIPRVFLNGKPLFQYGVLDQGWWPDGLYTAPCDEALRFDLQFLKDSGFNMVRKHVKVEPQRWYHHCDQLGLLVWQDMPSGDRFIGPGDPDVQRSKESAGQFETELSAMMDALHSHPSVIAWVPFNEGWGQYDTARISNLIKQRDPSRLVDSASGWTDRGTGDLADIHVYPGPALGKPEERRAAVLGEFGGLGLALPGHRWQEEGNWGYRSLSSREELERQYGSLMFRLKTLVDQGLCAAIYTQLSDVEVEVNGLLTYDRRVEKLDRRWLSSAHAILFEEPWKWTTVLKTSEQSGTEWRYTTVPPAENWTQPKFDDSSWERGPAGFGTEHTPGSVVRTPWTSNDLWLRREVELPDLEGKRLALRIHHDEDAEVHANGVPILEVQGYTTSYTLYPIEQRRLRSLRTGLNLLAVHCHQTSGGQYLDLGLVSID